MIILVVNTRLNPLSDYVYYGQLNYGLWRRVRSFEGDFSIRCPEMPKNSCLSGSVLLSIYYDK